MTQKKPDIQEIFSLALDQSSPEELQTFLDSVCEGNTTLRAEIEDLLDSHHSAGKFLRGYTETDAAADHPASESGGCDTQPDDDIPLDFLRPADEPDVLGCLGDYTITDVIGRGGMGIVLKGQDRHLNRTVAIKVLAPELSGNATARKRFVREAQAAAAIVHQHVITIHAVHEDRLPYLVMEYVHGQSLQERIDRDGPLELKEILRIGTQVASGLAAAHAQGLIHRDVKPSNIMLENGVQRVRLTDFGLARAVDDVGITRTGEITGTPQFMSPEQAQGHPVDARTDLFSLGSVLYTMSTGRSPFRAETTVAALRRVCDDAPRPIREVNPDIPAWLTEIIEYLLQKDPDDRIQSAAEVAELLSRHLAHLQDPISTPIPAIRPVSSSSRRTWRHRMLGVLVVLLVMMASLGFTESAGFTHVVSSVIHIVTGEGTLVVEVDDPEVRVAIEGSDVVITGAGPREVRLSPGQYQLRATRDGEPVKTELVTITRGGRRVVNVSLEAIQTTDNTSKTISARDAFVILGRKDDEHSFETLNDAVQASNAGDTIEIRDDGPFITDPILVSHSLTIKAGNGYRPVLRLSPDSLTNGNLMTVSQGSLVLEGLVLECINERLDSRNENFWPATVGQYMSGSFLAMNCRFVRENVIGDCINNPGSGFSVVKNCEFVMDPTRRLAIRYYSPQAGTRYVIENCCVLSDIVVVSRREDLKDCRFQWRNNTIFGSLRIDVIETPDVEGLERASERPIVLDVTQNVLNPGPVEPHAAFYASFKNAPEQLPPQTNLPLSAFVRWRGAHNLFSDDTASNLLRVAEGADQQNVETLNQLNDWNRYWELSETSSLQGPIRCQNADLWKIAQIDPQRINADDFRLRPDSAGYRAGPDGKDLGADIDFVGPGEAYSRWKQTREFQEWREQAQALMVEAAELHAQLDLFDQQLRQAQWQEASQTFDALLHQHDLSEISKRVSPVVFVQYGIILVHLSESDRYRQFCGELIEEFATTENLSLAENVCRTCLIVPTEMDLSLLPIGLVDAELQRDAENQPASRIQAQALFAYRSGDFEDAVPWASEYHRRILERPSQPLSRILLPRSLAILAMAQYKSGEPELATKTYEQAKDLFEQLGDAEPDVSTVYTAMLMREAAEVLGLPDAGDNALAAPKPSNDTN